MNLYSKPKARSMFLVSLMVLMGLSQTATAWHLTPDGDGVLSDGPPASFRVQDQQTGIIPVDRETGKVVEAINSVNDTIAETFRALGGALNNVSDDASKVAQQPLTLFRDGAGGDAPADPRDAREGGFGEWSILGGEAWSHQSDAAFRGSQGYTQATIDTGEDNIHHYPGRTHSLLLSPEIDLQTHPLPEERAGGLVSTSSVYSLMFSGCDVATALSSAAARGTSALNDALCPTYRSLFDTAHPYSLDYQRRFNLGVHANGTGIDGVTAMVFTATPDSIEDLADCAISPPVLLVVLEAACTIVNPSGGYPSSNIEPMPRYEPTPLAADVIGQGDSIPFPGYAGFSPWMQESVDLSHWAGQTIQVGFYFASSAKADLGANYFAGESFNTGAGFYGFQLDDLTVRAPAGPINLRVREPIEPSVRPDGTHTVTVAPDSPLPVRADVTNLGSTSIEIIVTTRILDSDGKVFTGPDGTPYEVVSPPMNLTPGHIHPVSQMFADGLPTGKGYSVQVCAFRTADSPGGVAGDPEFCTGPAAEGACSGDLLDGDPCDDMSHLRFDVLPVPALDPGDILRSTTQVPPGGELTLAMPAMRNTGNIPLEFNVTAQVIQVGDEILDRSDLLDLGDEKRHLRLGIGESASLAWNITTRFSDAGQYHLFLRVDDAPVFDAEYDLLPAMLRPWASIHAPADLPFPALVNNTSWLESTTPERLPDGSEFRVGNTAEHLYITVDTDSSGFTLLFDDRRHGAETGFMVTPAGGQAVRYNASGLDWEPIEGTPLAEVARTASESHDHAYVFKVPLEETDGLSAGPGEAIGVLLRSCASVQPETACAHYPVRAPLHDGAGLHPASGDLDNETARWHAIRLHDAAGDPTGVPGIARSILGPGFGVGMAPPPLLLEDFMGCPSLRGWANDGDEQHNGGVEKWNCAEYPDAGRTVLYQGLSPDSACDDDGPCLPYSDLRGIRRLWTRPLDIPSDATLPTLLLAHQYSTPVTINDRYGNGLIAPESLARLYLEKWNGTGWTDLGLLRPDGGYTTEEEVGIARSDARHFFTEYDIYPLRHDLASGNHDQPTEASTWWWPQGPQPLHDPGERYRNGSTGSNPFNPNPFLASGHDFTGGSPWRTDTIPLHTDFDGDSTSVSGSTVRLRFEYTLAPSSVMEGDIRLSYAPNTQGDQSQVVPSQVPRSANDVANPFREERLYTAFCLVDLGQDGSTHIVTSAPEGCDGSSGSSIDLSTGVERAPAGPRSSLPGTVLDWVDVNGDGVFNLGDDAYLNVDGTDTVQPGDRHVSFFEICVNTGTSRDCNQVSLVAAGHPDVGRTYCGTTRCSPTASTAAATDLERSIGTTTSMHDSRTTRTYIPSHAFNSGALRFDESLDWGWRIGGIAVLDGDRFARDVAVASVGLDTVFDPHEIGVGPGTSLPVVVTVRNEGDDDAQSVRVRVVGRDVLTGDVLCDTSGFMEGGQILPGGTRNTTLECHVPEEAGASVLSLTASVSMDGEDYLGNNQGRVRGVFAVQAARDAAVSVDASPREATKDTPRVLTVAVENLANVPLEDATVSLRIERVQGEERALLSDRQWSLDETLQVGQTLDLSQAETTPPLVAASDLTFHPSGDGTYVITAQVTSSGDSVADNDNDFVTVKAQSVLYRNTLESAPTTATGLVDGLIKLGDEGDSHADVWRIQGNSHDGTLRLLAGDPLTGDLPADADVSVRLPTLDLTTVREATLSFQHKYDLEEGFDAARVEVSTDGGQTWSPLHPRPQPLNGLDEGYPSQRIFGDNALLGDDVELEGAAYTGSSGDLPGNMDGWLPAEFDLTRHPDFLVRSLIEDFALDGLASAPGPAPLVTGSGSDVEYRFTHLDPSLEEAGAPTWALDEGDDWFDSERYWWIANHTYSDPLPRFGQSMWWSGDAGTLDSSGGGFRPVDTTLTVRPEADDLPIEEGSSLVLSWWDWRAGWREGDGRPGTGGVFTVTAPDGSPLTVRIVEALDSGWTRREADLTPLLDGGDAGASFNYVSDASQSDLVRIQNNRGWFIDRLEVVERTPAGDEVLLRNDAGSSEGTEVEPESNDTRWSRIQAGQGPHRDGGWHIDTVSVPGAGSTPVWRFSSSDPEGYPAGADSMVVAPRMDLRDYGGDEVLLHFDHRYSFHGEMSEEPTSSILRGVDAGTVVYQVYDEKAGRFGPWQVLIPRPTSPLVGFTAGLLTDQQAVTDLATLGYPSIVPVPPASPITGQAGHYTSMGHGLPTLEGWRTPHVGSPSFGGNQNEYPFTPYPFAPVFSGDSGGWQAVEWDVSHLIGKEVRIGFHAVTNPSETPCNGASATDPSASNLGVPNGCVSDDLPRHGWSVANMRLEGQTFQGKPTDIRLRVATDGSFTKGEWSIDDITVSGARFQQNIAIRPDEPEMLLLPGQDVGLTGNISNLGTDARSQLALVVQARTSDGEEHGFEVLGPSLVRVSDDELPGGVTKAWGTFDLARGGEAGSALPIHLSLDPIPDGTEVQVQVRLLEGVCEFNEQFQCTRTFRAVQNEVGGAAAATWHVTAETRQDLALVPPLEGRSALLVATPGVGDVGNETVFSATVANRGTTEEDLTAQWTVLRILRKGGPDQAEIAEVHTTETDASQPIGAVPVGGTTDLQLSWTPEEEGLYRILLDVEGEDGTVGPGGSAALEILVGDLRPYYLVDFAKTPATDAGWQENTGPDDGPEEIRFRQVGGQLLWGVSHEQFAQGVRYCDFQPQNWCAQAPSGGHNTVFTGLYGEARSPPTVDLTQVVGGNAVMTLRDGHVFESPGDGGVLEMMPVRPGTESQPVYRCVSEDGGDTPAMWFRIHPADPGEDYGGTTVTVGGVSAAASGPQGYPERRNPLDNGPPGGQPVFGGTPTEDRLVRFFLSDPPEPVCPEGFGPAQDFTSPSTLINYTVQIQLRVGTLPGFNQCIDGRSCDGWFRNGAMGWQIDSLSISSVIVEAGPDGRELPILDGHPKTFRFQVTNLGSVEETFHFALDQAGSAGIDPSWITFPVPSLQLQPGEARTVPFVVTVPQEPTPPRGTYVARLLAHADQDANIQDGVAVDLVLAEKALPDLAVLALSVDAEGEIPQIEQDTIAPVALTVGNRGVAASEQIRIRTEVTRMSDGVTAPLDAVSLDALCPDKTCDKTTFLEWKVPTEPGKYLLRTEVDPDGRLVEMTRSNNVATLLVEVVPLQRPDVAVTDLRLGGVGSDGYATEGGLVTITANVTNLGFAPATGVEVRILSGTAELLQTTIDSLIPGETREVTAARIATAGETTVRAVVIPPGTDLRTDNNELRTVLRTRGVGLELIPEVTGLVLAAGGQDTIQVTVNNTGNAVEKVLLTLDDAHSGWGFAATPNPLTVAPDSSAWTLVNLVAPADATAGTHRLHILGTPQSQPGSGSILTLNVTVPASIEAPLVALASTDSAPGATTLHVRLVSQSNDVQTLDVGVSGSGWASPTVRRALPAGGDILVPLAVTIPTDTPPGPETVQITVQDPSGTALASAEGELNVTARPAGEAIWRGGGTRSADGDLTVSLVDYTMDIANTGNVPFRPMLAPTNLTGGAQLLESDADPPVVAPGETQRLTLTLQTSTDLADQVRGRVEVWMQPNATQMQELGAPTARQRMADLAIPSLTLPDLVVKRWVATPARDLTAGDPLHITVTVANEGIVSSPTTELLAFVNGDLVNAYPTPALPPGGETTLNMTWTFPGPGEYLVSVVANGAHDTSELYVDNNALSRTVAVQERDLIDRAVPGPAPLHLLITLLAAALVLGRRNGGGGRP